MSCHLYSFMAMAMRMRIKLNYDGLTQKHVYPGPRLFQTLLLSLSVFAVNKNLFWEKFPSFSKMDKKKTNLYM